MTEDLIRSQHQTGPEDPAEIPKRWIPGFLFRRAYQVVNALWAVHVGDALTSPQYAVLASIYQLSVTDQITITRMAGVDRSTLAEILARLDARGLIVRSRDVSDGRRNDVSLSEEGSRLYELVTPKVNRVDEDLVALFDDSEARQFLHQLVKIVKHGEALVEKYKLAR